MRLIATMEVCNTQAINKENTGMKKAIKFLSITLLSALLLSACGETPVDKISAARNALDAAVAEGAELYTPDDLARITKVLDEAMAEVKVQDDTFFKNYTTAEFYLNQAREQSVQLKAKVASRKDELKVAANNALLEAQTAIAEAKGLLEAAPQGKGSVADIEAMKGDVAGLETELESVPAQIEAGGYTAATEKALAVAANALTISNDIRQAQEKLASVPQQ